MPIDTTTWPEMLRQSVAAVAPGWTETHEQGDQMGDEEEEVVALVQAAVAERHPGLEGDASEREVNRIANFLRGYGRDFLWINDHLPDDLPIGRYATLGEYDRKQHDFQEKARAEMGTDKPEPTPYRGRLSDWFRMIEDGRLVYGNLTTLAHHVFARIEDGFNENLDAALPHVSSVRDDGSTDAGEETEDGVARGLRPLRILTSTVPPGREELLKETRRWMWDEERRWRVDLLVRFETEARRAVWRLPSRWDPDLEDFVFSDPSAIDAVRPESFLSDCVALARPKEELDAIVDSIVPQAVADFVRALEARIEVWETARPAAVPA